MVSSVLYQVMHSLFYVPGRLRCDAGAACGTNVTRQALDAASFAATTGWETLVSCPRGLRPVGRLAERDFQGRVRDLRTAIQARLRVVLCK